MDKTWEKVTKGPKRVEAARKGRENYMNKLKEGIFNDAKIGSGDTSNENYETTSSTTTATIPVTSTTNTANTKSSDTYVNGVGIVALLAIGVYVFFAYNTFQAENRKLVNKKQDQPPKRRNML